MQGEGITKPSSIKCSKPLCNLTRLIEKFRIPNFPILALALLKVATAPVVVTRTGRNGQFINSIGL